MYMYIDIKKLRIFDSSNIKEMNTTNNTAASLESIIESLMPTLRWISDRQKIATDGQYSLVETVGMNESTFTLYDGDDNEVKKWKE